MSTVSDEFEPVAVKFIEKVHPLFEPHRYKIGVGGRGGVKCLALGTNVIMYDGTLRRVEDVLVGDLLMGPDSTARTVLSVHTGSSALYRVTQTSGMSYAVNESHLLSLKKSASAKRERRIMPSGKPRSPRGRYPNEPDVVHLTPGEWMAKSQRWKAHFRGFRAGVLTFEKRPVQIDPYFLGVWLGDGTARELRITSADQEIIDYCQEMATPYGVKISLYQKPGQKAFDIGIPVAIHRGNPIWAGFKFYGLKNNKHIPHAYIANSEEVRLALLAGLIDTDGTRKHNGYTVTQSRESLARQIKYVADSLGFRTHIAQLKTHCSNNGARSVAWRVGINGDTWRIPCKVRHKQIKAEEVRKNKDWRLSEISIEPCGDGAWAGFEVDGDHQFLLEDGTVTHNSWSFARALLIKASQQPLRILCGRQIQNSLEESVHHLLESQIPLLGLQDHFAVLHNKIIGKSRASEFIYTGLAKHTKQSIKSYEGIDIFWGEEAVDFSKASWDMLIPTIRKPGSEIWITFNPELDTDETYVRFVLNPPDDAVVMRLNWEDNPWFSHELEMERRACLARSKEDYENIWMGKPRTVLPGAVYAREVSDLISRGRYAPLPYDSRLKVHTIWDMGWNGACTIHLVQTQLSALRIIGYLEGRFVRIDEWAALLNKMPLNWGWDWLPHDGYTGDRKTGLSDFDILRAHGRHVRGKGDSVPLPNEIGVEAGMKMLRHTFPLIYVHKGPSDFIPAAYTAPNQEVMPGLTYHTTERLVECWKRLRYNIPKHGEPQSPIPDEYMHACDGTRYLATTAPKLTNEDEWSEKPIQGLGLGGIRDRGMGMLG